MWVVGVSDEWCEFGVSEELCRWAGLARLRCVQGAYGLGGLAGESKGGFRWLARPRRLAAPPATVVRPGRAKSDGRGIRVVSLNASAGGIDQSLSLTCVKTKSAYSRVVGCSAKSVLSWLMVRFAELMVRVVRSAASVGWVKSRVGALG